MQISPELRRLLESLANDFFGSIELSVQNGQAGVARVVQTHNLKQSSREPRSEQKNGNQRSAGE